jgi:hypothetical protein
VSELDEAIHIAERILERPWADPDDDLAILSRQLLRALERPTQPDPKDQRIAELEAKLSDMALKHGGANAGHAYGPTNCSGCGTLSNDYYLVGKGQLCIECYDKFPAILAERDAARAVIEAAREAAEADPLGEDYGTYHARLRKALDAWDAGHMSPDTTHPRDVSLNADQNDMSNSRSQTAGTEPSSEGPDHD